MELQNRIFQLERELIETRDAAAEMIAETIGQLVASDDGREVIARAFDDFGDLEAADEIKARLAPLIAAAIRKRR